MSYPHCRSCDHPMRPAGTNVTEYPGTRRHSTNGLCHTCRRREVTAIRAGRPSDVPHFDVEHARYALESWLANLPSRKARA